MPDWKDDVTRAHLILRQHGTTFCRDAQPECFECPVSKLGAFGLRYT